MGMKNTIVVARRAFFIQGICHYGPHSHGPIIIFIPVRIIGASDISQSSFFRGPDQCLCKTFPQGKDIGLTTVSNHQRVFAHILQPIDIILVEGRIDPLVVQSVSGVIHKARPG